jgi:hypothetical protein
MVVRIAGEQLYLWHAVDDEGAVLDMLAQRLDLPDLLITKRSRAMSRCSSAKAFGGRGMPSGECTVARRAPSRAVNPMPAVASAIADQRHREIGQRRDYDFPLDARSDPPAGLLDDLDEHSGGRA